MLITVTEEGETIPINSSTFWGHSETLTRQITEKWQGHEYTDLRFVQGDEEVHCHKVILAARCTYFNTMFLSHLPRNSDTVHINDIPINVFRAVVEFIYTGKVEFGDSEAFAVELLQTADMMDFADLKQVVGDFLSNCLYPNNSLGLYEKAITFSEPRLKDRSFTYALQQFNKVKESEEFLEASFDVIKCYLAHADVNAESEEKICTSAINWLKHNRAERNENTYQLLSNLRLHDLNPYYIQMHLLSDSLIQDDKQLLQLLTAVLHSISYLKPLPVMLQGQWPRSNTEVVTGIALIRRNAVSLVSLLKRRETYKCRLEKEGMRCFTSVSKVANKIDNTLVAIAGPGYPPNHIYKYDVFADQWTTLPNCQLNAAQLSKVFVAENKEIYRLVYKIVSMPKGANLQIMSLQKYFPQRNRWQDTMKLNESELPVYTKEENMSLISYNNHVYIFGTAFHKENVEKVHIIGIDLHRLAARCLDFSLPETLTNLSCIVYKEHVLFAGNENCYILPLNRLQDSFNEGHNQLQGNVDTLATKQNKEEKCLMIDEPAIKIEAEPAKANGNENTLGESPENEKDRVNDATTDGTEALNTNELFLTEQVKDWNQAAENVMSHTNPCVLATLGGIKNAEKTTTQMPKKQQSAVEGFNLGLRCTKPDIPATFGAFSSASLTVQSEVNLFHLNVLGNLLVRLQDRVISVVNADRVIANEPGLSWAKAAKLKDSQVECMAIVKFYKDSQANTIKLFSDFYKKKSAADKKML